MFLHVNGDDVGWDRGEKESNGEKRGQRVQVIFERVAERKRSDIEFSSSFLIILNLALVLPFLPASSTVGCWGVVFWRSNWLSDSGKYVLIVGLLSLVKRIFLKPSLKLRFGRPV